MRRYSFYIFIIFALSCTQKKADRSLFQLMENTGIDFINKVEDQEIDNSFLFRNFYNGGGVGIGDINNDGLADILLTSNMGENKLYLNKGNFRFDDITASSGMKQDSMWSTGIVMVDINNDGWLDMYICNSGNMKNGRRKNKLYINNRNLTFTESATIYGLDISCYATQASFFDYDLDGDLDCFIIANSPMPVNTLGYSNRRELPAKDWPVEPFVRDGGDHLYRNDNGSFIEVTKEAGIHGTLISFGLGVSVGDINNDGYPDIYVSNDSYERDYLYINQKNGSFRDQLEESMQQISFSSMGADLADINNDGFSEIFTTDMLPEGDYRLKTLGAFDNIDLYNNKVKLGFHHQFMKNCLQLNNGNGSFSEIANFSNVDATDWSWGALIFDADNDGLNDIYVCNGVNKDVTNLDFMNFFANDVIQKMVLTGKKDKVDEVLKHIPVNPVANKTYRNKGNLQFEDVGENWGLAQPGFSNGAAYADLDNDGDLDLVVNNENQKSFVYKNNSRELNNTHFISLSLKGDSTNTFAIGSKVKIYNGNHLIYRELIPSRGFQSSMDYKMVIGLGAISQIDSMIIEWPDLSYSTHLNPAIDTLHIIEKSSQRIFRKTMPDPEMPVLFDSVKTGFDSHQEDDFIDFYFERNIPAMLSREGPRGATADINGDGLSDIFIGGTKAHAGQIYIQRSNGSFEKKAQPVFYQFAGFEDGAAVFFDADGDGDQDLFIGAAGNNQPEFSRELQPRLLINDGHGQFSLKGDAFTPAGVNTIAAAAHDVDRDGDIDLFIGGRCVSGNYGKDPRSYLFLNNGSGRFTEVKSVESMGMVTGAIWEDINGDSRKELIVVGEWMPPKIYAYDSMKLTEIKTNLKQMKGWWQTVAAADVDNDGKMDLLLGNIGENFYLHPEKEKPVKLWMNDFDNSGEVDKILTWTADGKDKPVFLKNDIQDQVPGIKKENLKHHDYALKSIGELFPAELVKKAAVKEFNFASSVIALNKGDGKFEIVHMPSRAQLSSVNAIRIMDLNKDELPDMILAGNRSGFPPQLQKIDASFGEVYINKGKGDFQWVDYKKTNIGMTGDVKDILSVSGRDGNYLLFLRNNMYPKMYKRREDGGN